MSENKRDKDPKEQASSTKEDVLQLITKGMGFTKELLQDNEKLRYKGIQLQEEIKELSGLDGPDDHRKMLELEISRLEKENMRLAQQYNHVEEENKGFANRYVEIEVDNNNLANLYVCSFQLHSTLVFDEVVQIIMEIIINLIGAEEFGILLLDGKTQTLKPIATEGVSKEDFPAIRIGEGSIGNAALSGENYYHPDCEPGQKAVSLHDPMVCIPLKIKDDVIGVIVLYKLLPQKTQFANVDYELFTLLAGHAATAIFSSRLYSDAQRKLNTIQGFMELLTK